MLNGSKTKFYQIYIKELVWKGQISIKTNLQESMHDDDDNSNTMMIMMIIIIVIPKHFSRIHHFHFHPNLTYVHTCACMPPSAHARAYTHTCN